MLLRHACTIAKSLTTLAFSASVPNRRRLAWRFPRPRPRLMGERHRMVVVHRHDDVAIVRGQFQLVQVVDAVPPGRTIITVGSGLWRGSRPGLQQKLVHDRRRELARKARSAVENTLSGALRKCSPTCFQNAIIWA